MTTATKWFAWIDYAGQWGGDTTIDAPDAGAALSAAMDWARRGVYEPADEVEVNVMLDAEHERTGRLEPEVGTIIKIAA